MSAVGTTRGKGGAGPARVCWFIASEAGLQIEDIAVRDFGLRLDRRLLPQNQDFPHETTVDQWFSESQFESYCGLGFSIMERAHKSALENYKVSNSGREIKSFAGDPRVIALA